VIEDEQKTKTELPKQSSVFPGRAAQFEQAKDALRESEEKWRFLLKSSTDAILNLERDGTILFINHSVPGYTAEDTIGKTVYDFLPPEEHEKTRKAIEKVFQTGEAVGFETSVIGTDGNLLWYSNRLGPVKERDKVVSVAQISTDITERKKVEEALRESENSYRAVVENAVEGIVVVQGQTLQFVNPAIVSMMGYSEKELLTRPFIEFIHPDHREWAMGIHIKRLKGEEVPPIYALKAIDKEGNTRWLENNGILINWGNKPATLNFLRDITERKKAEQAIWASESEKKSILNAISDQLLFHDTDLAIRWGNEAVASSIGMTQRELVGCYCYELWYGRSEPCERCPVIRAIETCSHTEGIMTTPDGKWWEVIGEPVCDMDGKIRGAIEIARDITERKKAENALQESEQRFKVLFESAPDAIYLNDLKGNIVDGNKAAEEMTGYKREELIGKNIVESGLLSPEQVPEVIARLEKNAMGKSIGPEEFTLKRKDGSYVTVEVRTFPVKIGNQTLSLGIARDISAHKKAAEALREERDRAQKYLDVAAVIFVVLDANGRVTLINNRGCEILRYKEEDIIGKNWFDNFLPEGVRKDVKAVFKKLCTGNLEPVEYFENPILTKDGDERLIAWNNTLLRTEQGEIIGTLSSGEDITERKRAEETYRSLVDHSLQGLAILQDERIVFTNHALAEVTGYTIDELLAMSPEQVKAFVHPDDCELVWNRHRARLNGEEVPERYEFRGIRKDGSTCWLELHASRIEFQGKPAIQEAYVDITERKKAEQKLLDDQEQLKSLASQLTLAEERERRRIASDLHDQISQSLVISKMKLEALCKSGYGEELDKALDEVCNSLGWTIQDTRTLTFDLSSPILYELGFEAAAAEWLDEQIRQKHGIETEFEDDEQPKPLDDDIRVLLFRDVRELLINVVKHANAQNVKVSIYRIGEQVCVSVEDDGVGFDPDKVASMAAKKAEFGLFSIRQRLEQLRGHLEIKSEPGHGSRITMVAPLKSK